MISYVVFNAGLFEMEGISPYNVTNLSWSTANRESRIKNLSAKGQCGDFLFIKDYFLLLFKLAGDVYI